MIDKHLKKFWIIGVFLLSIFFRVSVANVPETAILDSSLTRNFTPNPLFYSWEMEGAFAALKEFGISYQVLHDDDLTTEKLSNFRLLILPSTKDMSPKSVQAIKSFVRSGGKVFATGFASYRNEHDQPAGEKNNFQLSDLFGVDYLRFNTVPPSAGGIRDQNGERIALGRNTAIQVHLHPGTVVLGEWLNDDGVTLSFPKTLDAAAVQNGGIIYVGENLFAPENSQNPKVKLFIASLLHRLLPSIEIPGEIPFLGYPHLPSFGEIASVPKEKKSIEVGLPFVVKSGYVTSESRFSVLDEHKSVVLSPRKEMMVAFSADENGFTVAGRRGSRFYFQARDLRYPLKIVLWRGTEGPLSPFKFAAFRDSLILKQIDGKPMLVNRLSLDSYLSGVVSHEVPFHFHADALKAMAVVARTFAEKEINEKKFNGFDICATVQCQAYEGLAYEAASSREAVEATVDNVVNFQGRLADLPYAATCGGISEDIEKAWNLSPVPYLRSVVDGEEPIEEDLSTDSGVGKFLSEPHDSFCKASSRYRWKEMYTQKELTGLFKASLPVLLKRPVNFSIVKAIDVTGRTPHGRVTSLKITTDTETFSIGKDQIRWLWSGGIVGLGGLQSTFFVLKPKLDPNGDLISMEILGGGWGHGVGLCQFGAEGMAARGYSWQKILSHYFPGTAIQSK